MTYCVPLKVYWLICSKYDLFVLNRIHMPNTIYTPLRYINVFIHTRKCEYDDVFENFPKYDVFGRTYAKVRFPHSRTNTSKNNTMYLVIRISPTKVQLQKSKICSYLLCICKLKKIWLRQKLLCISTHYNTYFYLLEIMTKLLLVLLPNLMQNYSL